MTPPSTRLSHRIIRRATQFGLAFGLGGSQLATRQEHAWVQTVHLKVPVHKLPDSLQHFKIAHLTDIHRSRYVSRKFIKHCVQMTNEEHPDIILLTGDYVTHSVRYIPMVMEDLAHLKAKYGVYAVLGNHDYWTDPELTMVCMQKANITPLVNESVFVPCKDSGIWICGVDDLWAGLFDLDKTFEGTSGDHPRVLLMHNPDSFKEATQFHPDLILCGHTHGGQVSLPTYGPIIVPSKYGKKYASGLFHHGSTTMFVNKGLGLITPPVRVNVRPEIAIITLQK